MSMSAEAACSSEKQCLAPHPLLWAQRPVSLKNGVHRYGQFLVAVAVVAVVDVAVVGVVGDVVVELSVMAGVLSSLSRPLVCLFLSRNSHCLQYTGCDMTAAVIARS